MRDPRGKATGAVCINFDVTELIEQQRSLERFVARPKDDGKDEVHYQNVNELLEHYLQRAEELIGKPAQQMDKRERMEALAFLDERGILQIAKAHVKLCDFFGISKYTLYSYIDVNK